MRSRLVVTSLVVLVSGLSACGSGEGSGQGTDSTTGPAETTSTDSSLSLPATTTGPSEVSVSTVNVYWAWSIPTVGSGTPEKLGAGGREVPSASPARGAMEALLAGPDPVETEISMGSEIPAGTTVHDVSVGEGVATVDLSADYETPGGTLSEAMRVAQVVFTLTQFDTVEQVRFRIDGVDVDEIGSHGMDVSGGVDRDDVSDVRPFLLLERPVPGAVLDDGFTLSGESNTFEATVQWTVADSEGLIVAEGFTTATSGNGQWGSFAAEVDVPDDLTGRAAVIVWEQSARDGSQINVVEYPVEF